MAQMTGGQAIVAALRAHGVYTVFGIPSVYTLPIYDTLYDVPFAQSLGAAALEVTDGARVGQALKRALGCPKRSLIELRLGGPGPQ